jgi:hypothetical protein
MTTDEMQLLRDFRSDIPEPDEETIRQAYAYATRPPRATRRLRLHAPATNRGRIVGVAALAGAAALIGVFAVPSTSSHHSASGGVGHNGTPRHIALPPAVQVPLSQASSDAMKWFDAPLILPDTPSLKPSDGKPYEQWCAASSSGAPTPLCQVDVQFTSPALDIEYVRTAATWGSRYPDALDQYKAEIAQSAQSGHPDTQQIVHLSDGTPALISASASGIGIEFRLGKLSISVWNPDANGQPHTLDAAALQALAQSIVDQAGSATS